MATGEESASGTFVPARRSSLLDPQATHEPEPAEGGPADRPRPSPVVPRLQVAGLTDGWLRFTQAGGPLLVLFYGFPVWWVLGLANIVFLLAGLVMATHLFHLGLGMRIPRGFWVWSVFLVSVLLSSLTLGAQAPHSVPGDDGSPLTFGYRLAWYLVLTIILLYVGNLDAIRAPARTLARAAAFMFVLIVAGGLLGVLAPTWEAKSLVEMLLPGSLASNEFVQSLVHLQAAEVQSIIGERDVRPTAPFPYANTWGAALAAYLPFFGYAWLGPGAGWRRFAAPPLLLLAGAVAVASLNRALWASLLFVAMYAAVQVVRLAGPKTLPVVLAVAAAVAVVSLGSGAGERVQDRFEAGHSDDRRGNLASITVDSVLTGSPVIGFGNVRRVEGSFASIAGGATPECPQCAVPQMGTQGQLWLVLFSQGLVGVLSFISFILYRLWRHARSRDVLVVTLLAVPIVALIQLPFYDSLGAPLAATLLALALMWRAEPGRETGDSSVASD